MIEIARTMPMMPDRAFTGAALRKKRGGAAIPSEGGLKGGNSPNGFTLVELMVASFLLLLVFVALLITFMRMLETSVAAQRSMDAMHIARNAIEELRSMDYHDIESYAGVPLTGTTLADHGGVKHCVVTESGDGYKEVVLTIEWRGPGGSSLSTLDIATKICDPGSD